MADPRVPLSALEVDGIRPRRTAQLGYHLATQRQGESPPAQPAGLADLRAPLSGLVIDPLRVRRAAQLGHHPLAQLYCERFPRLYPLPDREARRVDNIPIHGMTSLQLGGLGA